uniref:Membrane protein n=1 Tax=Carcinus maenas virus 1 TaxID=2704945 RepID=A0A6G9HDE1_9VIRU|nr:membrane protein [Carcinus maenas virus 1]
MESGILNKVFLVMVALMTVLAFVGTHYSNVGDADNDLDLVKTYASSTYTTTILTGLIGMATVAGMGYVMLKGDE